MLGNGEGIGMADRVKVGVIGTGGMGARHARNLATLVPDVELTALMDVDQQRVGELLSACGGARVFDDGLAVIRDSDVEALVIASPDPTHADLTLACIEAEKPVLCEKPLATTLKGAAAVVQAEVASGKRLIQLGFMRVYDPIHLDVKAALKRGDLGRSLMFRGIHNNLMPGRERSVEDVATNSAVHDFHSARWLMSDEITKVSALSVPIAADRPDSCRLLLVQLTFKRGGVGTIEVNASSGYGYEVMVEVTGETGAVTSADASSPTVRKQGARSSPIAPDWLMRFEQAYIDEISAWARSLQEGRAIGPSAWDGYMSLAIADATIQSIERGEPVDVHVMDVPAIYENVEL